MSVSVSVSVPWNSSFNALHVRDRLVLNVESDVLFIGQPRCTNSATSVICDVRFLCCRFIASSALSSAIVSVRLSVCYLRHRLSVFFHELHRKKLQVYFR